MTAFIKQEALEKAREIELKADDMSPSSLSPPQLTQPTRIRYRKV